MRRRERVEVLLALLGVTATILAATIPSALQLIDDDGDRESDRWVSCVAAVERVVELLNDHPSVAHLYTEEPEYMPALLNQAERDACGDPRYLIEGIADSVDAQPEAGRAISRK